MNSLELDVTIERKSPDLPRFVVIAGAALEAWSLQGTTVVELTVDGVSCGRRSLKRWGGESDRWFIDLSDRHCKDAGVDTGDDVRITLTKASTELPVAIRDVLLDPAAARRWASLTPSQQRQIAEHVRAAKRPETRVRRARSALLGRCERRGPRLPCGRGGPRPPTRDGPRIRATVAAGYA